MIFRNLDNNNDWTFGKGKNDYLIRNDAILLNIKTRLLSFLNDCFFDLNSGIDWLNRLGLKSQDVLLENDISQIIQKSDDVTGITSIETQFDSVKRTFLASYTIDTIFSKSYADQLEITI